MRDTFHIFPDISATSVSTAYAPANVADFGASDKNTPKFNSKHKSGAVSKEAVMVFELGTATVAVTNIFTLGIQDTADDASPAYKNIISGPTITVAGTAIPIGTRWTLPLPLVHLRYIRPVVTTGTPWGATRTFKCWIEMGRFEDGRIA